MHVKIFYGQISDLEKQMNEWLKEVYHADIVDIKTIVFKGIVGSDAVAVFIFWD